jgi:hypothetical protein
MDTRVRRWLILFDPQVKNRMALSTLAERKSPCTLGPPDTATALSKLTTRIARGAVRVSQQSGEIEIFTEAPGKQATVRRSKQGESTIVFDGQTGWRTSSGRQLDEVRQNVPIDWSGFVRPSQAHAALANSKP